MRLEPLTVCPSLTTGWLCSPSVADGGLISSLSTTKSYNPYIVMGTKM